MYSSQHSHDHGHRRHDHHPGHHFGPRGHRHGFGRGDWRGPEEGRGGRRRRVFDSNELRLVLLKLIADQPRHGYELIRAIKDLTGGFYVPSPGVVYPTLTMLQEMEQIGEVASSGTRKAFVVTAVGTGELVAKAEEVEALFARLAELATRRERSDGGPIRRAMQNLKMVLISRLDDGEVKTETLHQVAAILDDAAQKIERL